MTESNGQRAVVTVTDRGLQPTDLDGLWRIAQLVAGSGLAPKGMERPESIAVAMAMGSEVGLSPMQSLQQIAVINGRPSIWGDAALALVRGSGMLTDHDEGTEGEGDSLAGFCQVHRKGDQNPHRVEFSVADAKAAGLWTKSGPWKQYPKRMLVLRARGFALRDKFPDVLRGVGIAEEVRDISREDYEVRNVVVDPLALPAKADFVVGTADEAQKEEAKSEKAAPAVQSLPVFGM